MAEFDNNLLHFDSIQLDVNENPSNAENRLSADNEIFNSTVPSNSEVIPQSDLTVDETLLSSECVNTCVNLEKADSTSNCIEKADSISNYIEKTDNTNNYSLDLQNVDECNQISSTLSETLHFPTSKNSTEMPEVTKEILTDKLDTLASDVKKDVNNRNSDSGIHDSENNIVEDMNMMDFDLNIANDCNMITEFNNEEIDVQVKDEEFHDAVQFFKDPSSFTFLENAGSTNAPTESLMARSSLYVNFDPLHAKFYSQPVIPNELLEIAEDDTEPEVQPTDNDVQNNVPIVVNKHLTNISPRESLGNILISFDSPLSTKGTNSETDDKKLEPQKLYTEEEFQQALKIQELTLQESFLKKQHDLELARSQKQEELETKLQKQSYLCNAFHCILEEIVDVANNLSEKEKVLQEKLEIAEKENNKLGEDLKTSAEDIQSVESTFSDFHKRYEQCKNMLKVYSQNEDSLKQQLESMKVQLQEKDDMYKVLQSRTEEMLNKANTEVANVKKAGDAQVAVLKAQLKKAELKISSLESDVKHVKIENGKLSSICDDLMAKVSEG